MIRASSIINSEVTPADTITLPYEDRYRRRIMMRTDKGLNFLLDLPKTTELTHGINLVLDDGRHIRVIAAKENLIKISAKDFRHLLEITWHIGNRHLACEIKDNHLLIKYDYVILDMLKKLGANVEKLESSFNPHGGAYGFGRTHSHDH